MYATSFPFEDAQNTVTARVSISFGFWGAVIVTLNGAEMDTRFLADAPLPDPFILLRWSGSARCTHARSAAMQPDSCVLLLVMGDRCGTCVRILVPKAVAASE